MGNLQHQTNILNILMFCVKVPLCSVNKAAHNLSEPMLVVASTGVVCL